MHVRFATPTGSGIPCSGYIESMDKTVKHLEAIGWNVSLDLIKGDVYVQRARNDLAANFLKSDATHLLFIDDDMVWPAEAAEKLLSSPRSVTCGAYRFKSDKVDFPIVIDTHPENHRPLGHNGWVSVVGAPTGFLCIHRGVIETLIKGHPELEYDVYDREGNLTGQGWDLFPQGVRNRRWWGEDYAFCNLWRGIGGMIWCWPDITLGHTKRSVEKDSETGSARMVEKTYWGNFHNFLRAEPMPDAA